MFEKMRFEQSAGIIRHPSRCNTILLLLLLVTRLLLLLLYPTHDDILRGHLDPVDFDAAKVWISVWMKSSSEDDTTYDDDSGAGFTFGNNSTTSSDQNNKDDEAGFQFGDSSGDDTDGFKFGDTTSSDDGRCIHIRERYHLSKPRQFIRSKRSKGRQSWVCISRHYHKFGSKLVASIRRHYG